MVSRPLIAQGYSLAEEVANSISHGIGLVFGGGGRSSGGLRTCRPGKESVTGADKGQKVLQGEAGLQGE